MQLMQQKLEKILPPKPKINAGEMIAEEDLPSLIFLLASMRSLLMASLVSSVIFSCTFNSAT